MDLEVKSDQDLLSEEDDNTPQPKNDDGSTSLLPVIAPWQVKAS